MINTVKTEILEKYLIEHKLSKTNFCKMCKISYSTFKKIMSNKDNYGIIALFKISKIIKVKVCDMLN